VDRPEAERPVKRPLPSPSIRDRVAERICGRKNMCWSELDVSGPDGVWMNEA